MTQRIIRRNLSWCWSHRPSLAALPCSLCRGYLSHHISSLLREGVIRLGPLQRRFTSHVFLVPKATGGERYRPIASHFAHSLRLIQNAGRFKNKKFHSHRGLLYINRHLRCLPPYSHSSSLPNSTFISPTFLQS